MSVHQHQENVRAAVASIRALTDRVPTIGIICGSGLSELSESLSDKVVVPYSQIRGFPDVTVVGHMGELVFGTLHGTMVVCMRGRFHSYEGHDMNTVVIGVRVMHHLGVKTLIVTNAAGGLHPDYEVGDVLIVSDHINLPGLAGKNPLVGPNDDSLGERFFPMSDAYPRYLRDVAWETAQRLGEQKHVHNGGVYCFVSGPGYETPHESLFLRNCGGCSVGMSTVPEVMAARHCGMKVLLLSMITNKVVMPGRESTMVAASHTEVTDSAKNHGLRVRRIVEGTIARLANLDKDPIVNSDVASAGCKAKAGACLQASTRNVNVLLAAAAVAVGVLLWLKK